MQAVCSVYTVRPLIPDHRCKGVLQIQILFGLHFILKRLVNAPEFVFKFQRSVAGSVAICDKNIFEFRRKKIQKVLRKI